MHRRLSLRERLVLLVLAANLPLAALSVWLVSREIDNTIERAHARLRSAAQSLALVVPDGRGSVATLSSLELQQGSRAIVVDRSGRVHMAYPSGGGLRTGDTIDASDWLATDSLVHTRTGELRARDGSRRVYAAAPTRPGAADSLFAIVDQDRDELVAAANRRAIEALLLASLGLAIGLAGAWWVGGRVILKPVKQILGTVRRLEQGYLHARVPVPALAPSGEFAHIASAFNLMADSLQMRRQDLEAELGRSREAYAVLDTVINSMQEGLAAIDMNGHFLLVNEAAARVFDLAAAERIGARDWPTHFGVHSAETGELMDPHRMPLARAIAGESGEMLLLVRNAKLPGERLLRCYYRPMGGDHGITGGLAVFSDVTALQKAEADLLAFTRMLQRTAEAAPAISRHRSTEDTVREVEAQARRVLDAQEAELRLGPPPPHEVDASGVLSVRLTDSQGRDIGILRVAGKAGGEFGERDEYVAIELAQLAANAIENARLFERIRDLNANLESRIAERTAELAAQSGLYRTLAEQAPEVVWNTDASGTRLTFLNRAWYELVGGTEADWIGKSGRPAIHPDDLEEVSENWKRSRETLTTFTGVRRLRGRDGSWHTMSYKGAPVLDDEGQVVFWVGVDSDITSQKVVEEALRSANQELEAFSYSVSHDLRAPLGAIDGFSKALASRVEGQIDDKSRHYLARIQAGVARMEQLIEALLGLSRVAREAMNPASVDLGAVAREALEQLQASDPARRVEVRIQGGMVVEADPGLLRVMMDNLLGNAWKFTAKAERPLIEVGRSEEHGAWFVRDNGVGFDMTYAGKLFNAFQRLHTESEFPGTGIGLATVRRIVARHEGRVWAESEPGAGTTFYFTLGAA